MKLKELKEAEAAETASLSYEIHRPHRAAYKRAKARRRAQHLLKLSQKWLNIEGWVPPRTRLYDVLSYIDSVKGLRGQDSAVQALQNYVEGETDLYIEDLLKCDDYIWYSSQP